MKTISILNDSTIHSSIATDLVGDIEYYFYILKNNKIIHKSGWIKEKNYEFKLTESGVYSARGFSQNHLEKIDSFSNQVTYINNDFAKQWDELKNNSNYDFKLDYHCSTAPHKDLLFIATKKTVALDLHYHSLMGEFNIFSNFQQYGFSGSCFIKDEFIFGEEDVNTENLSLLEESCGDFSFMKIGKEVLITNDFFGNQKLYYYFDKNDLLVSNRLHLLFKYIKKLNINLIKNQKIINSLLVSGSAQPFQQVFSKNLAFQNLFVLEVDKKISMSTDGIYFENKNISKFTGNSLPISDAEYEILLHAGTEDLKRNFRNIKKNKLFKSFMVDLTGGMDSRVVFSTVNNFAKKDICINACKTLSNPKDIQVAVTLNSFYTYQFDQQSFTSTYISQKDLLNKYYSSIFGTYFAYNPKSLYTSVFQNHDSINLTGFYGEITLRPYYSKPYLHSKVNNKNITTKEFVNEMINNTWHDLIHDEKALKDFSETLESSLESIPTQNSLEKYDLLYLYFRNGLHCSDIYRFGQANNPRVSFIQSKNFFTLKNRCFEKLKEYPTLLQNDVIGALNPFNLLFDYSSEKDDIDFENCKSKLTSLPAAILNAHKLPLVDKVDDPDLNRELKICNTVGKFDNTKADIDKLFLHALFSLIYKYEAIDENLGKIIFVKCEYKSNHILMNKVTMLYLQFLELDN